MALVLTTTNSTGSLPIYIVHGGAIDESGADAAACSWAKANGFKGAKGQILPIPGEDSRLAGVFFGIGLNGADSMIYGRLAKLLPSGKWHFSKAPKDPTLVALALKLGAYSFSRYSEKPMPDIEFFLPDGGDKDEADRIADGIYLTRDLVNTPANDLGPAELAQAAQTLAQKHDAQVDVIIGDELLTHNLPLIHAVGRAAAQAPRLIDLTWGEASAPKLTLVGKGVCFDTGGLDIKTSSSMLLMKKDMGGAAHVLGLASMIMAAKLPVRLRVLIPAVENSISANAFRPGDILPSRQGLTIEVGNTDAEGRLVLADALTLADEEMPDLLINMATLTGAARVALGPELPPFYTDDEGLAGQLMDMSARIKDPMWRMPLWDAYAHKLKSRVADINNIATDAFAGSIIAALFLKHFVSRSKSWVHFDIFSWTPTEKPTCPIGAEAQAIRTLYQLLLNRYGR